MTEIHFEREPGQRTDVPQLAPPKEFLAAAVLMVACVIWLAVAATRFDKGRFDIPDGKALASRALTFADGEDHGIVVRDGSTGAIIKTVAPNTEQFLRGAIRGLAGRRRTMHKPADTPFTLTQWDDGRLTLDDPATGERIAVSSFGPTQVDSFRALLLTGK
jgi:putative photosynthetic complex assembly protein